MAFTSAAVKVREEAAGLSRAAVTYGVRELARRAGVPPDLLRSWRIEFEGGGYVTAYVQPGTNRRFRFRRISPGNWKEIQSGVIRTSVAAWPSHEVRKPQFTPNLIVPFSSDARREIGPLFTVSSSECVECPVDLAASAVLTLSRFEETLPHRRDEHDRYSAFSSVAWREGFLHRPIVDEWGLALEEALRSLLPNWKPEERQLRVKLGHDADVLGIPMRFRTTVAHTLRRPRPDATARDLLSLCVGIDTTYQRKLRQLVQLALDRGLPCAAYWKFSKSGRHDTGYDPRDSRIQGMISEFQSKGIEMGIHPGYQSFRAPERLRAEVHALQELFGRRRLGGRQDYVRWSPELWTEWEALGLAYDASVGFADQLGFRAGTCHPYRPWLTDEDRQADLLEIPMVAMDTTLRGYMKLTGDEALQKLHECVAACRAVGGVFSLVWHNTTMMDSDYSATYRKLLDELTGCEGYDWENSSDAIQ